MKINVSDIPDINELNQKTIQSDLSNELISTITPTINSRISDLKKDIIRLDFECNQYDSKIVDSKNELKSYIEDYKKEKFKNDTLNKLKGMLKSDKKNKSEILFLIDMLDKLSNKMISNYLNKLSV